MRIAFVYPGIVPRGFGSYTNTDFDDSESMPILAISTLAGVAVENGHTVELLDLRRITSEADLEQRLSASLAEVVAITVQTPSFNVACRVAELAKRHKKITIAGGVHATVAPEDFKRRQWDHVVSGEGEIAFVELLNKIRNGEKPEHHIQADVLDDLDTLPLPYYFHEWREWYLQWYGIEATRGCVGKCTYCVSGQKKYFKRIRSRSDEHVLREIEHAYKIFHFKTLSFTDVNITSDIKRFNGLLLKLLEQYPEIAISIQSRADTFNEETAQLMTRFGGGGLVFFGFESASPRILEFIRKRSNPKVGWEAVQLCKKYGIRFCAMFIIGIPNETVEDIWQSYEFSRKAKPDIISVNICSPFPGTPLYDYCEENHLIPHPVTHERFHIQRIFERGLLNQTDYGRVRYWQALFNTANLFDRKTVLLRPLLTRLPKSVVFFLWRLRQKQIGFRGRVHYLRCAAPRTWKDLKGMIVTIMDGLRVRQRVKNLIEIKGDAPLAFLGSTRQVRNLRWLTKLGKVNLVALLEPDVRLWGSVFKEVDIYPPGRVLDLDVQGVLVADDGYRKEFAEVVEQIKARNIEIIPLHGN